MLRSFCFVLVVSLCSCALSAQSFSQLRNVQVHGFATQAIVYSNANNYLGMSTSDGSVGWTEGAINLTDQLSEKVRVGVQFHVTHLGTFGGGAPSVDWALADFRANEGIGVRAGKVKIRWGLYNDTQDADPGYLWSLMPEPVYAIDWRATNLSQWGGEIYGKLPSPRKMGEFRYSVYCGYYFFAANDGYMEGFKQQGLFFSERPWGKTPGFDLLWKTPMRGLSVGGSLMAYDAKGRLEGGTFHIPLTCWPTYYAQFERKKISLSYQYVRLAQYVEITSAGSTSTSLADTRGWFATGAYRVTDKLQLGVYHTRYVLASAGDDTDPANYYRDWAVSGRYDINSHWYTKLEGHFIDGTGLGFYNLNNPNGLEPQSAVLAAKVGFVF
jgi:hypothetical protein